MKYNTSIEIVKCASDGIKEVASKLAMDCSTPNSIATRFMSCYFDLKKLQHELEDINEKN